MKLSVLNADFNGPSLDILGSRKPAHKGIKLWYPRKSCDEMAEIDWQFANRNCYRLLRVSWALAQISCFTKFETFMETIILHQFLKFVLKMVAFGLDASF